MLLQLGICSPVLFALVLYTDTVKGEMSLNCGPAAVGQPYKMECTGIPDTVTNGINVFLEGESNSIIFCSPTKNCFTRNDTLYNVTTKPTTSLSFYILKLTADNIGKTLYCVNGAALDLSSPNCTIPPPPTTVSPTTSTSGTTDGHSNSAGPVLTTSSTTSDGDSNSDGCDGLCPGEIVAIVVCVCGVVLIVFICVLWNMKCWCFAACGWFPCECEKK